MHSSGISTIGKILAAHQAPTGILIGPLEDSNSRLIHPAVVLMKLLDKASATLSGGERRTNVSCNMSLCTSFSSRRSLNICAKLDIPPMPEPRLVPTSDGWTYW